MSSQSLKLSTDAGQVSALLTPVPAPMAAYIVAHGAGAGMQHPFLERISTELANRDIASLRYQFPYMEQGRSRTDSPVVATATVRAAVALAVEMLPGVPILAGGKSFGGRMTSTAAADAPLPGVRGLVFLGFPLHAPHRPSLARADHLSRVTVPMLFLQGTRDDFAELGLIRQVVESLPSATLHVVEGADHSFGVRKKDGRTSEAVMAELADTISLWSGSL